jgi:rare lipoprotein A
MRIFLCFGLCLASLLAGCAQTVLVPQPLPTSHAPPTALVAAHRASEHVSSVSIAPGAIAGTATSITRLEASPVAPVIEPSDASKSVSIAETAVADKSEPSTGWQQQGIASWYGPGFQGRRTANGERFDTRQMTAAHRTLPFGARVRVTSLVNGKYVIVRINDRGPYIKGRIIDLSHAAAQAIGLLGIKQVKVERLQQVLPVNPVLVCDD